MLFHYIKYLLKNVEPNNIAWSILFIFGLLVSPIAIIQLLLLGKPIMFDMVFLYSFIGIVCSLMSIFSILVDEIYNVKRKKLLIISFVISLISAITMFSKGESFQLIGFVIFSISTIPTYILCYKYMYKQQYLPYLYMSKYKLYGGIFSRHKYSNVCELTKEDILNIPINREILNKSILLNESIKEINSRNINRKEKKKLISKISELTSNGVYSLIESELAQVITDKENRYLETHKDVISYKKDVVERFNNEIEERVG